MMFGFSFWDEYIYLDEGMMTKPVVVWLGTYQTLQHTSAVSLCKPSNPADIHRYSENYP